MRLGDILKAGGWESPDIPTAASVTGAESGFRAKARNSAPCGNRKDGSPAFAIGLMQVCTVHLDPGGLLEGWTEEDLENPVANARASKIIFDAQGWGAWTTYASGAFKSYPNAQNHQIVAASTGGRSLSDTAKGILGSIPGITALPGIGPFLKGADILGVDLPDVNVPSPGDVIDGAGDALSKVGDAASVFGKVATALTNPDTWWRIGKGYLGGTLIILGAAGLVFVVAKSTVTSEATKAIKAVT